MAQQFKNMNELVEYLGQLEDRVKMLEDENGRLRAISPAREDFEGTALTRTIANSLPRTNLLHSSFLKRAFTVWGHFFVANLLIGIALAAFYLCIMMVILGPAIGDLLQNLR